MLPPLDVLHLRCRYWLAHGGGLMLHVEALGNSFCNKHGRLTGATERRGWCDHTVDLPGPTLRHECGGGLDDVVCRSSSILQLIDALTKRRAPCVESRVGAIVSKELAGDRVGVQGEAFKPGTAYRLRIGRQNSHRARGWPGCTLCCVPTQTAPCGKLPTAGHDGQPEGTDAPKHERRIGRSGRDVPPHELRRKVVRSLLLPFSTGYPPASFSRGESAAP